MACHDRGIRDVTTSAEKLAPPTRPVGRRQVGYPSHTNVNSTAL